MSFHVGQRVVCVDDKNWSNPDDPIQRPVAGCIYTIRSIGRGWTFFGDKIGVRLEEIINRPDKSYRQGEAGFLAHRFRPIKETDISIFTAMLNPAPTKEKV